MTPPDLSALAEGLTEAQRRTLLTGREPDGRGKWPLKNALTDKGLARTLPWMLTPLGLKLRAHLTKEKNDGKA